MAIAWAMSSAHVSASEACPWVMMVKPGTIGDEIGVVAVDAVTANPHAQESVLV